MLLCLVYIHFICTFLVSAIHLKTCFLIIVLKHMYELWTTQEFKCVFPYGYLEVVQDMCNEALVVMMCHINSLLHTYLSIHVIYLVFITEAYAT